MSIIRTQMTVACCAECPMFERHALSVIADLIGKREAMSGTCRYSSIGMAFPHGRVHVPDMNTIPPTCPLRTSDCLIQLKVPG